MVFGKCLIGVGGIGEGAVSPYCVHRPIIPFFLCVWLFYFFCGGSACSHLKSQKAPKQCSGFVIDVHLGKNHWLCTVYVIVFIIKMEMDLQCFHVWSSTLLTFPSTYCHLFMGRWILGGIRQFKKRKTYRTRSYIAIDTHNIMSGAWLYIHPSVWISCGFGHVRIKCYAVCEDSVMAFELFFLNTRAQTESPFLSLSVSVLVLWAYSLWKSVE